MNKPEHYLPYLDCAQRVINSREDAEIGHDMTLVQFDLRIIETFIGHSILNEDREMVIALFVQAAGIEDECFMWQLAHVIQHLMEDTEGMTAQ